jgi:hypothetical protein
LEKAISHGRNHGHRATYSTGLTFLDLRDAAIPLDASVLNTSAYQVSSDDGAVELGNGTMESFRWPTAAVRIAIRRRRLRGMTALGNLAVSARPKGASMEFSPYI